MTADIHQYAKKLEQNLARLRRSQKITDNDKQPLEIKDLKVAKALKIMVTKSYLLTEEELAIYALKNEEE